MSKLLVVVDYQNDFVNGALGFKKAKALEKLIYDKVNDYLKKGHNVVFTYDTHYEDYLESREGRNLPIMHCIKNTNEHKLYGKINSFTNVKNTLHYEKEGFAVSPKDMIKLANELAGDIREIEIVGVVTNICVISNAIMFQSQYKNAEITLNAKLCASFDDMLHNEALDIMEGLQMKVINR